MKDKIFKGLLALAALLVVLLCAGIVYALTTQSMPAFQEFGFFRFLFSTQWVGKAGAEQYGALPFIIGTLATSFMALFFCLPLSLAVAFFTGEFFKNTRWSKIVSSMVDLLAGIPSIVYGLWGFYTLRPLIAQLGLSQQGFGILTASLVLTLMILPYAASLSSEFFKMVPDSLKEGAYALGGSRSEVVLRVVFPSVSSGVVSSFILALGRALGETMAVTMLIGNTNGMPQSLFGTGNTMASVIANQFGEAQGLKLSSLIAIGLLLFILTACINAVGRLMTRRKL